MSSSRPRPGISPGELEMPRPEKPTRPKPPPRPVPPATPVPRPTLIITPLLPTNTVVPSKPTATPESPFVEPPVFEPPTSQPTPPVFEEPPFIEEPSIVEEPPFIEEPSIIEEIPATVDNTPIMTTGPEKEATLDPDLNRPSSIDADVGIVEPSRNTSVEIPQDVPATRSLPFGSPGSDSFAALLGVGGFLLVTAVVIITVLIKRRKGVKKSGVLAGKRRMSATSANFFTAGPFNNAALENCESFDWSDVESNSI
ncbi:MAG: hypothetical protein SGCHY_001973 [Lobulomycetales sp.]